MEQATFGAGCFWSVQHSFDGILGVVKSEVGYMGGTWKNPSYEDVCTDKTGHAEVVHIEFDPRKVSYEKLVRTFFSIHDPTTPNRQGPDIGTQYRSVIFFHTKEQKKTAMKIRDEEGVKQKANKIVTEIAPAKEFYRAEEYHQKYLEKRGRASCSL